MAKSFHPLLALIASGADRELAKYVEFLKEENKILRARIPGQVHTKPDERRRLVQLGKALGRGVEALLTIVSVSTFYRWCVTRSRARRNRIPRVVTAGAKSWSSWYCRSRIMEWSCTFLVPRGNEQRGFGKYLPRKKIRQRTKEPQGPSCFPSRSRVEECSQ